VPHRCAACALLVQARARLLKSAFCTDLHARLDDWPLHPKTPLVGGHEGVGFVVAIGEHTPKSPVKIGDRVGIKWLADSCLQCELCRKGLEQSTSASR
jgi:propanol-preferring alcohol dehydrogenase